MSSKGRPYRRTLVDGFEVLIGRGARENDQLTFDIAAPVDHWLHVAGGTPGSHVVIRNPERCSLPATVIESAAAHAAWYSKARGSPWVKVHHCRVSAVSKPKGAPAGLVRLARYEEIKVRPAPPPDACDPPDPDDG